MKEISELLAEYSYNLNFSKIDKNIVEETKKRVIDSIACALGALKDYSVEITRKIACNSDQAKIFSTKRLTCLQCATFSNTYSIRFLDWNDTYLSKEPAHPSDNIGATLTIAEHLNSSGKDFILATILAYEIQCRLCDLASLRKRGWDHVNYILVSSSIASSKLLDLDIEKTKQSINIALNNLSTRQNRVGKLSNWKAAAAANACRNGVFASLLAKEGFTGPEKIFEGIYGFQNLVSGKFKLQIENFGKYKNFKIGETYIKKHNAEYHSQSAIDAALKLREKISDINEIKKVLIETHEAGFNIIGNRKKDPDKWNPKNKETADHSLPYIVAVALMDGEVTDKQYEIERIRNEKTLKFLKRIYVVENKKFTKLYPERGIANKVTIYLKNGKKISEEVIYPRGHPRNPMSLEELKSKFLYLSKKFLDESRALDLFNLLMKLENLSNIKEIFEII